MNFALVMLIALLVTGGVWLLDRYALAPRREKGRNEPWWVEYSKSFFPVILIVFLLRSFLVEPFKIPSGSMMPTLLVGDFILVNKYTWGIRLPVINRKVIDVNSPQRGDVMVFRYPQDSSLDYIKRVVGLPGDKVSYRQKQLIINGKPVPSEFLDQYNYTKAGLNFVVAKEYRITLGEHVHHSLVQAEAPAVRLNDVRTFPGRESCDYNDSGFTCLVPDGHLFVLGDNRDDSNDSRYWGFVPETNIVGKAFMIWWNFEDFGRIGQFIK